MSKFIVDTTRTEIINKDMITRIYLSCGETGYFICANMVSGNPVALGKYDSKERVMEVFYELLRCEMNTNNDFYLMPQ